MISLIKGSPSKNLLFLKSAATSLHAKLNHSTQPLNKDLAGSLAQLCEDIEALEELMQDNTLEIKFISAELQALSNIYQLLADKFLFNDSKDAKAAYLDIQPGTGGAESQEWALMLQRMYLKFLKKKGFKVEITQNSFTDTGLRACTLAVDGAYAYGWLKWETGVHRLIRKSPFDSAHRRHTSFASVYIYPQADLNRPVLSLNPQDLRIDTFRSSGPGGQHVNKTDSAVRIVHLPTGLKVECQSGRSQHQNKEQALAQLQAKLDALAAEKLQSSIDKERQESKAGGFWGNYIRSYIIDKSLVKDHRINQSYGNPESILDGELEELIFSLLYAHR